MTQRWLLRMVRWARNPPSPARVKFVLVIFALCAVLFAWEQMFGWPDALSPDPGLRRGYKP